MKGLSRKEVLKEGLEWKKGGRKEGRKGGRKEGRRVYQEKTAEAFVKTGRTAVGAREQPQHIGAKVRRQGCVSFRYMKKVKEVKDGSEGRK